MTDFIDIDFNPENRVETYNKLYPKNPAGPFPDHNDAFFFCDRALKEGRELTDDERRRFEYQDNDDIYGSRFR